MTKTRIATDDCTRFADWPAADVRGVPLSQVPLAHPATTVVRLGRGHVVVVVESELECTGAS